MSVPKNYRKNLNIRRQPEGFEQRQDMLDNISRGQPYLPRGITYEDMDREFMDFVKNKLEIVVEGEKVPVYSVSIQRWYEFYNTWQNSDEFGNLKLPFILITRKLDVQKGTNQATNYNIPGFLTWSYIKVPITDGIREGHDIYKIPQPVPVDIEYEVRFFTTKIRNLNSLNSKIQRSFSSRQSYIYVNEHPMPLILETIGDESQVDNIDQRKFYVQPFTIKLMGYTLNEEDFQVVPAVSRVVLLTEVDEYVPLSIRSFESPQIDTKIISLGFQFNGITLNYETTLNNSARYLTVSTNNVLSYSYLLNGNSISLPFDVSIGDTIKVIVNSKNNNNNPCSITFNGVTL